MKVKYNINYALKYQPESNLDNKTKISKKQLEEIIINNPSIINSIDENGETIFSNALNNNNYEIYDIILNSSILNLGFKNNEGNSYLHLAVINQNEKLVKELIKKGININIQNNNGNTALHLAYKYGNSSIIKVLTQNGINTLIKNKEGKIAKEIKELKLNKNKSHNYNNFMNKRVENNQNDFKLNKNIIKPKRKIVKENYNINNNKNSKIIKDNNMIKLYSKYFRNNPHFIINNKKQVNDNIIDKMVNLDLYDKKKKMDNLGIYESFINKEEKPLNKISFKEYNINNNYKEDELSTNNYDNINCFNNTSKETKFVTDAKEKSNNLDEFSSFIISQSLESKNNNNNKKENMNKGKINNEYKSNYLIYDNNDIKSKKKENKIEKNYKSYVHLSNINSEKYNTIQNNFSQKSICEKHSSNNNNLKYKMKNHLNSIHKNKTTKLNQLFSNKIINNATSLREVKSQNSFINKMRTKKSFLKKNINYDNNSNIRINHILKKRNINRTKYNEFPYEQPLNKENSKNINKDNSKKILSYIEVNKNKLLSENIKNEKVDENGLTIKSSKLLQNFLSQINMDKYIGILALNGFDDINLILEQSKNGISSIQDNELKEAGIKIPGDRAKILIRIQELSHNFNFPISKEVYYSNQNEINFENDKNIQKLKEWIEKLKIGNYFMNFINCGYYSIELLFVQMASSNSLNNEILKDEIGIQKVDYRERIIDKLKEDSKNYIDEICLNKLVMNKGEENTNNCQCIII